MQRALLLLARLARQELEAARSAALTAEAAAREAQQARAALQARVPAERELAAGMPGGGTWLAGYLEIVKRQDTALRQSQGQQEALQAQAELAMNDQMLRAKSLEISAEHLERKITAAASRRETLAVEEASLLKASSRSWAQR